MNELDGYKDGQAGVSDMQDPADLWVGPLDTADTDSLSTEETGYDGVTAVGDVDDIEDGLPISDSSEHSSIQAAGHLATGSEFDRLATVGETVSQLHKQSGIPLEKLAERTGLPVSTLSDFFNGRLATNGLRVLLPTLNALGASSAEANRLIDRQLGADLERKTTDK